MTTSGTQLSLAIDIQEDASLQDFEGRAFLPILSAVYELLHGKVRELYIFGAQGSGKSHLMSAIVNTHQAQGGMGIVISMRELAGADVQALAGLEMFKLIILDDIHLIRAYPDWQESLFHLINRARTQGCHLIYTAPCPPIELDFGLPDLTTRLSQVLAFGLPAATTVEDRHALLTTILRKKGWQLPQTVLHELAQAGPQYVGDMLKVVGHIVPYFGYKNRWRLTPKMLEQLKSAIKEQSLLVELSDIDIDLDSSSDNLDLPY